MIQKSADTGSPNKSAMTEDEGIASVKQLVQKGPRLASTAEKNPIPSGDERKPEKAVGIPAANISQTISKTKLKLRHVVVILSFICAVAVPSCLVAYYLWYKAEDQYASTVGFSVRTEEMSSAVDAIIGITQLSGSSSSDTDILYAYLQSQQLVAEMDAEIDLRSIWAKGNADVDFWFSYHSPGTIEDLLEHWLKKVRVSYDSTSGLIDVRVLAFDPVDAQKIAFLIAQKSSERINKLSDIAREDAIRYAREELELTQENLKTARLGLLDFRSRTLIIDPILETQSKSGLIAALESQLAEAQIMLLTLQQNAQNSDTRIRQAQLRVDVIRQQIAEEKSAIGASNSQEGGTSEAQLVGMYEELAVELEFAQEAYAAARIAYDSALQEARRQSRYLANHIEPTLAEQSQFPQRYFSWSLVTLFSFLLWSILVLIAFALKDRK